MRSEEIRKYLGENCKIALSNSSIFYTGKIIIVGENSIEILDKFNHPVIISINGIVSIESLNFRQEGDKRFLEEKE